MPLVVEIYAELLYAEFSQPATYQLEQLQRLSNNGARHRVTVDKSFCVTTTRYSVRPPL